MGRWWKRRFLRVCLAVGIAETTGEKIFKKVCKNFCNVLQCKYLEERLEYKPQNQADKPTEPPKSAVGELEDSNQTADFLKFSANTTIPA
ncbi:MAG: hypothetical protein FWG68_00305 [Defluviitaleaceae bacterium]|nr:hypothetical protein [Defluviitaleaceae bacterium]